MYEYKVLVLRVKELEEVLNQYAKEGWKLSAMVRNNEVMYSVVVTLERERK